MARKTINVDDLRIKINDMLSLSTCSAERRMGMIDALTEVLHNTGNYRGFGYLEQRDVPEGHLPGIIRNDDGNEFPDETRVQFY